MVCGTLRVTVLRRAFAFADRLFLAGACPCVHDDGRASCDEQPSDCPCTQPKAVAPGKTAATKATKKIPKKAVGKGAAKKMAKR
jgi:hypothetical protein